MLRSIVHASFSFRTNTPSSLLKPIVRIRCGSSHRLNLMKIRSFRGGISNGRSMADVLEILGPLDNFLSSEAIFYVTLLRKCIRCKNFLMGRLALTHLVKLGFNSELFVSNILLDVCSKGGFLDDAAKLFDEMPHRDLISWCTIIHGYVRHGFDLEAYSLFRRMIESGLHPNHFVISSVLKACSAAGIPELGLSVHCWVTKCGLGFDRFVEIGLVSMYSKCGSLNDALKLFDEIPVKRSISWNAIISSYIQNGYLIEAVQMSLEMCQIGFQMDFVTLRIVMSASSSLEMLDFCKSLHVYSIKIGLEMDCFIIAELFRLLSKLGEVGYMSELFKMVKSPDVSLYTLLISGFHVHYYREEAVMLVEELLGLNMKPKEGGWINILNVCASMEEGMEIHAFILKAGYSSSIPVGNALISTYIRCGEMIRAYETFLNMEERDAVTWTTIMAGLTHNLHYKEALETFQHFMKTERQPDEHCVATVVNACTGLQAIDEGKQIHALSLKQGLEFCSFISASILHMYAKCGHMGSAKMLFFHASSTCDLILTNIMLAGYCWNSLPFEAFELFKREYRSGLVPDRFSFSTMLGACADTRLMVVGKQIHCNVVKIGFEVCDIVIQNAIVNMYAKAGSISGACEFYHSMRRRNITLYEMLMVSYLHQRGSNKALRLLSEIKQSFSCGFSVAFARVLRSSANLISHTVFFDKADSSLKLSGDYAPSYSVVTEYKEYGEEVTDQNFYIYGDGIYLYEGGVSRLCGASPILSPTQNGLTHFRYMNSEDYQGGLEPSKIQDMLSSMEADFEAWADGFATLVLGNNYSNPLWKYLSTLKSMNPKTALSVAKMAFLGDERPLLEQVELPCTVIQCTDDFAMPPSVGYYMEKKIKGKTTLEMMESEGHFPHVTAPENFIKIIDKILLS